MKKSIGINCMAFPTPIFVVGTYDGNGIADASTLAWVGVASSEPPSLAIAVRPSRYTYDNLILKKAFTVNIPSAAYSTETDYFGIASGRDCSDKMDVAGLKIAKAEYVDAPVICEFPVNIECKVTNTLELGSHTLFIGEVHDVKAEENLLDENGKPNLRLGEMLMFDTMAREYFVPGEVKGKAFLDGLSLKKSEYR